MGGYGQTLDTARFKERSDVPQQNRGPVEGVGDGRRAAQPSTEHNQETVDKVEDLSWAVESGLDLTDTVDCDRVTKHLPGK